MAAIQIHTVLLLMALIAISAVNAIPLNVTATKILRPPREILNNLLASNTLSSEGRAYIEDALKIDANISAYYLGDGKTKPASESTKIRIRASTSGSGLADSTTLSLLKAYPYVASAAYCNTTEVSTWSCKPCGYLSTPKSINFVKTTDMDFYGAYFSNENQIVVAFRGSRTLSNWISNLDFLRDKYIAGAGAPADASVHGGFQDVYLEIRSSVQSLVNKLSSAYPSANITFTGHSMGASLAIFSALDLATTGYNSNLPISKIRVITLGEPRLGNWEFGKWVSSTLNWPRGLYRVVNNNDIVPHLPYEWTGFRHHLREYWIDGDGDLATCNDITDSDFEDDNCANTKSFSVSTSSHLVYFGVTMGASAC